MSDDVIPLNEIGKIGTVKVHIQALKKENAELKEKLTIQERVNKEMISPALDRNLKQLTKAKEIIEKLRALYLSPVVTKDDVKRQDEILAEAEQFLKDSEADK